MNHEVYANPIEKGTEISMITNFDCNNRVYPKYTYMADCCLPTFNVKSRCKINAFKKEVLLRRCFFEETAYKCVEGKVKTSHLP